MSRIDDIKRYKQKCDEEVMNKEIAKNNAIEACKEQIRALKPRIDELLEVGNACKNNGIALTGREWGARESYDTHQFMTNSWSHLLGFVGDRDKDFTCLGIYGGGACDYNLATDGKTIEVSGDVLYILQRFIREFDMFEAEFYKYVDKVVGKEATSSQMEVNENV